MNESNQAGSELTPAALAPALFAALDGIDALVAIKDSSGRYLCVNAAMAEWLGRAPDAILGASDTDFFTPEVAALLRAADLAAQGTTTAVRGDHRLERGGRRREFIVSRAGIDGGRALLCVWLDVTQAGAREAQLQNALAQMEQQQQSIEALRREVQEGPGRDRVTGLYQQAQFDDLLRREVDLSSREHREFALAAIEIDPLSEEATSAGTVAEERVLEALGRLLRGNTRAMDASCRVDSRHFAVLLSGVGLATAHARMESMRRQCATQIVVVDGREIGFTVSMGVASFPHTAHSREDLIAAADLALAEARKRGGNHVTLASIRFEAG
jgi:diguanylate cyclase (GGDEF)-like protein